MKKEKYTFFDVYHLTDALQYLQSSVYASLSPNIWRKHAPANLLHFIDKLQALCNAAFIINDITAQRQTAIADAPKDNIPGIAITGNYLHNDFTCTAWNNFPRHLTIQQYYNPYKAISKFCKLMPANKWTCFLKELLYHSLCNDLITNVYEVHDVLKIQKRLYKLLEACHLIEMRTNGNE